MPGSSSPPLSKACVSVFDVTSDFVFTFSLMSRPDLGGYFIAALFFLFFSVMCSCCATLYALNSIDDAVALEELRTNPLSAGLVILVSLGRAELLELLELVVSSNLDHALYYPVQASVYASIFFCNVPMVVIQLAVYSQHQDRLLVAVACALSVLYIALTFTLRVFTCCTGAFKHRRRESTLVVLGLDGAGKTAILQVRTIPSSSLSYN